jgi:ligand-binding sensor domain-containing protein/two-component sensor histidine kinase
MRFAIFLILALSRCFAALSQQQYFFQHITPEDGLFANPNTTIYQDKQGYYWFSSARGLQRYDGQQFVTFRYEYKKKGDLSDNGSTRPVEDREGNIWTWNQEGISILRKKKARFERLYLPDAPDSNTGNVSNILKGNDGRLWIVTSRNIFLYDDSLRQPKPAYYGTEDLMHAVFDRSRNGIWVVPDRAPHAFQFFNCSSQQMSHPTALSIDGLFGYYNPISLLKFDRNNQLWISDYLGDLCRYDLNAQRPVFYDILHHRRLGNAKIPNSAIFDLADDDSSIWFSSDNHAGILMYSKADSNFVIIPGDNSSQSGLHFQNDCKNMFLDREDNIWVSTDMGLNIFNPKRQRFQYLSVAGPSGNLPFSHDVTSFLQTANREIWITTWGSGIFRYDSNFRLLQNYVHRDNDPFSLGEPLNETWSLAEDTGGKIVVGSQYAMLSVLDPATGRFNNRFVSQFAKRTIMLVATDKQHNFWFGLHSGVLGKWDARQNKIFTVDNLYSRNEKINHGIDGLFVDGDGELWCAAGDDAVKYTNTVNDLVVRTGIKGFHPLALSDLGDSLIIGGSYGNGLFVYNKYTKTLRFYTTESGLSSNIVYDGLADADHNIWIVTNESIERLNLHTGTVTKFGPEDGIRDHVFQRAAYKLKNGTLLVAANSGVIYFDPAGIRPDPPPCPVTITGIRIGQQALPVDSLLFREYIDIPFDKNPIAIDYGSLTFNDRNSLDYFYKLDGVDTGWVAAGKARSVLYANIASGRYQFRVKSQNREGRMSPFTVINIFIHPPWWRTWWAYLIWVSLAGAIAIAVYQYHRNTNQHLANIRQKIASDLHDDIGSTLNSISVYSEVAGQQLDSNKENAGALLKKMGAASRGMIDNMNDIVWAIHPKNDQFENVIERMQFFAAELLSGKNILLVFNTDEKSKKVKLSMEKRKNFYLIFKEAVTNAYKYSSAENVTVDITTEGGWLCMQIGDDGSGFDPRGRNPAGNGLKNMRSRSQEIGADLHISSSPAQGTTVQFKMGV